MTTTATQPARPAHVPADAAWNGEQWFTFNVGTGQWDPVPAAAAPAVPPLPAPGTNGQAGEQKQERPPTVYVPLSQYLTQKASTGGEGKFWKFNEMPVGTWYEGIVARAIRREDSQAQTDKQGNPVMQNGQYKAQLLVPMLMMPGGNHMDGHGVAVFKVGDSRDKLSAAMAYAGAPLTTTVEDGVEHVGYVPQEGAYIKMTKVEEQKGSSPKGSFTRFIYDVVYRCPDDPYTIQRRAGIEAAHTALAEIGAPPEQPAAGATPQAYIEYANALAAYQAQLQAAMGASNGAAPTVTPAAAQPAAAPPLPAPAAAPPVPAPAAPPVPAPAAQQVQQAAAAVVTADAGLPAATMPAPAPAPTIPPPATPAPTPAPAAPAPAPAAATPAPAPAPTAPATITYEQWLAMAAPVRPVVSQQTGVPIPADLDPSSPQYAGQ